MCVSLTYKKLLLFQPSKHIFVPDIYFIKKYTHLYIYIYVITKLKVYQIGIITNFSHLLQNLTQKILANLITLYRLT